MTAEEATAIMISGGGDSTSVELPFPSYIQYYNYQSSVQDYEYNGSEYIYGEYRDVPKDSIVIQYYIYNYETGAYKYKYDIYELIIEDIDTPNEEVVGIIDHQTNTEYRFQFNVRGGR